mgnify:CR=1 FL=1
MGFINNLRKEIGGLYESYGSTSRYWPSTYCEYYNGYNYYYVVYFDDGDVSNSAGTARARAVRTITK